MDSISEARLQLVCPALAARIRTLAIMITDEPITIRVTQGLRSWAEQQKLWLQGRDAQGNIVDEKLIVTNAPPGHSWHEYGLACDVAPFDTAGNPDWNVDHPVWKKIVSAGESLGLYSGSAFEHAPKDFPHFQLTGIFPVSPNDEVRQIFRDAGMEEVWKEALVT